MTTTKTVTETKVPTRSYGKIILTLENCILQDLDKPTPSEADGLDKETETDLRILGCELIQTAGILLRLPQVAMATGQVLFQRFFYSKSFVRHSMEVTAMSCICLASKIEEAPRRVRDVINVFHHIKQVRASKPLTPVILDQHYINLKSQVIKAERRVLKELGFCVHVKHPHKLIVMYLKYLEFEEHQDMMQMAWNFMNDSFRTDVFVRYQPEKIACACIYLTARKLGIPLPNNPPWYGVFKTSENEITDICYRILALYRRSKPQIEKLEAAIEKLKEEYQEQRKKDKGSSRQNTPPSQTTTVERTNGSHNAWGGFISRALPVTASGENDKEKSPMSKKQQEQQQQIQSSKSRSRSKNSRSISRSRSPPDDKHHHHHRRKRSRNRSRSRSRTPVKKNKQRNYSSSPSPTRPKHKKRDKKYEKRSRTPDRDRYTNGDKRDRYDRDYDRDYSRDRYDKNYSKSSYKDYKEHRGRSKEKDRYNNGSSKDKYRSDHHSSSKYRERSRDRRR